uniref:Glycosyltransferase n=1 Tax=Rhizophora mucronata TaxID=61149 RepID=A0A2P2JQ86_RHIMU
MADKDTQTAHVAILPSPGMGHLIPLAEFAKRLVHQHKISISFIIPTDGPPSKAQKWVLESLPSTVNYVFLPPVVLDDVPRDAKIETLISLTVARSLPSLREVLRSLVASSRLVALVVDLFATDAFDVAREFDVSPYIFFPSTAMTLSLFFYLPELDQKVSCEYRELEEPVKIPGCIPVHGRDLLDPVQDRRNDAYRWLLHHVRRYRLAEGVMVNSFTDMEGGAIKALQEGTGDKPPVYAVGPLVKAGLNSGAATELECLKWLNDQPHGSVLYASFGSGGTLSYDQIHELAFGLEMSEQRFLWVARSPNDKIANASFFSVQSHNDPLDFLPKGFLDRTKGRGLVLQSWAPQAEVLAHGSTGGFLTHCGWNSTLESVVNGVPLVAWPLYAEQKMNAVMLTEDIKVALKVEAGQNGLIGREEIANVVRTLMEGEEGKMVRNRMKDLKDASARVLSEDGSCTKALSQLAINWKKKAKAVKLS